MKTLTNKCMFKYFCASYFSLIVNLMAQYASHCLFYNFTMELYVSILIGTLVGFFSKFVLDTKYIFKSKIKVISNEGFLYCWFSIFITAIYFVFELSFGYVFDSIEMRLIGAFIGLNVGYLVKYKVDEKYVFKK